MGTGEFNAGGKLRRMDWHTVQGGIDILLSLHAAKTRITYG